MAEVVLVVGMVIWAFTMGFGIGYIFGLLSAAPKEKVVNDGR